MADDGPLADGTYDVIVVDADPVDGAPGDGAPGDVGGAGAVSLDLAVLAGPAKGEIVSVRATGLDDDPVLLLGIPGTLTVEGGVPRVRLEP